MGEIEARDKRTITGGESVVHALRKESVRDIFYLSGSCILPVLDGLYDSSDIRCIGTRHEQSAAHMADAYARVSGSPGVCLVHNGPGLTNTVTGIATSSLAHSPVVLISGAPMTRHLTRDSIQEIDQIGILKSLVKWSGRVTSVDRIPEFIHHGFRIATTGRKGPVHVDIPRDILLDVVEAEEITSRRGSSEATFAGDPHLIEQSVQLIANSRRPMIIAGGGVLWSNATDDLVSLAEFLSAPMATSYGHLDAVPSSHPLAVGQLGRDGSNGAKEVARNADLILAIGTRLAHFTTFYSHDYIPKTARIIQVEIEPSELGRNFPIDIGILGDARKVIREILNQCKKLYVGPPNNPERLQWATRAKSAWRKQMEQHGASDEIPIKPQRVLKEIRKVADRDAIITLDDGSACGFAYHMLELFSPRTFVSPLDLASIGGGYPSGLGAKIARPEKQVISISGDGGFSMSVHEIATAVQYRIAVVALILNNSCWGSEKAYQKYYYRERYIGSELLQVNFAEVAKSFGAYGERVVKPDELAPAISRALKLNEPAVIDVIVDPEELSPPARTDAISQPT